MKAFAERILHFGVHPRVLAILSYREGGHSDHAHVATYDRHLKEDLPADPARADLHRHAAETSAPVSGYLFALIVVLAFNAGWVCCAVFGAAMEGDRRCGTVDLSGAAARGELPRLAAIKEDESA